MKKFLHIASGAAKKTLYAAVKLAKKLTSLALRAAGSALTAAGKALKRLFANFGIRRAQRHGGAAPRGD